MKQTKFIFYEDWWAVLRQMPDEMSKCILEAIMNYALYGTDTEDPAVAFSIYTLIKKQIDRDRERYETAAERSHANGAKGGRPRKNPENPVGFSETHKNPENPVGFKKPNNININRNINRNININSSTIVENNNDLKVIELTNAREKVSTRFLPPTVEQVQAYIIEKGYNVDAVAFVDFYESKGWYVGKNRMKDWKAAVRTWQRGNTQRYGTAPTHRTGDYCDGKQRGDAEFARFAEEKLRGSGML